MRHARPLAAMPLLDAEPHAAGGGGAGGGAALPRNVDIDGGDSCPRSASLELATFEEAKKEHGLGFGSPVAGALILANTLLGGSGMLGISHAVSVSGWALGLVLIFVFGCCSAFGSHLLQCSARRIGAAPCSFYSVASAVVPNWTWLIDGAVMIKCFGVGTSYLIIVGDLAPDAMHFFGAHGAKRWHAIIAGFCCGGLLACQKNLSALRYTALLSVLIVSWTAVLIVLFFSGLGGVFDPCTVESPAAYMAAAAAIGPVESPTVARAATLEVLMAGSEALPCYDAEFRPVAVPDFLKLGKALPVFIFAFTCQQNVFTVCNEVREASCRRMDGMIVSSYLFSGLAFAASAILSYATYGNKIDSDMLKGYPKGGPVQLTRLLFAMLATFSFPMQVHPSRNSALALWTMMRGPPGGSSSGQREVLTDPEAGRLRGERQRFWICTVVGLVLSCAVALSVESLGTMLGVVGATGSTTVSYILPGLVYSMAFPDAGFKRALAFGQLGLGCIIMPTCLIMLFL